MEQETKIIKIKNGELIFKQTQDKEEWFSKVPDYGGFKKIEFSININNYFSEESWMKLPYFLNFLENNLKFYVDKANIPLNNFAKQTGYFNEEEQSYLDFGFGLCVVFLDNSFTLANHWEFELDFTTNNKINSIENIDGYGRWFVTFHGNCISGIRRENW